MTTTLSLRARAAPLIALAVILAASSTAHAVATLKGEYLFNGNLNPTEPGGPALTVVDPDNADAFPTDTVFGNTRTVYHFGGATTPADQGGFTLNTSGVITSNSYSVELIFKFDGRDNAWRRILDVHNRADDSGFYVNPSNALAVYPDSGISDNFTAGIYRDVFITNDNGHAKGYLDGKLEFTTNDTLMDVDSNNLMAFFLDNVSAGGIGEYSPGSIAALRVYDGIVDADTIANIDDIPLESQVPSTVPEPASLGLLILGGLTLLHRRRR